MFPTKFATFSSGTQVLPAFPVYRHHHRPHRHHHHHPHHHDQDIDVDNNHHHEHEQRDQHDRHDNHQQKMGSCGMMWIIFQSIIFWAPMSLVLGCFGGVGASLELGITYMFTLLKQPSDSFIILPRNLTYSLRKSDPSKINVLPKMMTFLGLDYRGAFVFAGGTSWVRKTRSWLLGCWNILSFLLKALIGTFCPAMFYMESCLVELQGLNLVKL